MCHTFFTSPSVNVLWNIYCSRCQVFIHVFSSDLLTVFMARMLFLGFKKVAYLVQGPTWELAREVMDLGSDQIYCSPEIMSPASATHLCLFVRFYVWAASLYLTCKPSREGEWMAQKEDEFPGSCFLTSHPPLVETNSFLPFPALQKEGTHPTLLSLPRLTGGALRFWHNLLTTWDDRNG